MALKKPSELFNNEPKKKVEIPEQLGGILPENFDVYKSNVRNIEVLNDFVSSFGTLKENIQKIDNLQEVIQSLKEELQSSITKEDLDTAMMSNLLVLEKNIQKIEFNLKGINQKDLKRIDEEIEDIESKVLYALEEEFPKYKKALRSNEIFIKDKFYEYSSEIDEKVNQFEEFIVSSFQVLQENLQSINDDQLIDIREDVVKSSQEVENQNQLIEKTKKQIFGIEKDVQEFYQKIQETFQSYQQSQEKKILTLEETISSFGEEEVKKYKSLLQETRIQNDEKIQSFEKNLTEKYTELSQSVSSLLLSVENKSIDLEETIQNKLNDIEESVSNSRTTLEETSNEYKKLIKSIEAKGLSDNQKFEKYQSNIDDFSNIIEELKENLEDIQSEYSRKEDYQRDITELKEQFTKKINLLENDISSKENKIKKVNQKLTETIENISNQFDDLNLETLNKKYSHFSNKISYIEEIFEKFNEKTVINEGLLNEPPTVKNSDPLTPLDKNYVTLDQLQEHYRLFINRVQQQLSTIGGGGETRLEFLDDVDRNSAKINGRFLKYDAATDKWVGALGGGGGSQTLDDTLGLGNTSSLGMSVGVVTATSFVGDGSKLTGIVTSITAGSGISINQSTGNVTITATGGGGGGESYWVSTSAGIHTLSNVGIGTTAKSDFKLFVEGNAKVTGILTVGNQSVTIDGSTNTIKVGSGVTINGNTGIISATAIYIAGSQVSTFSGNYNDLSNKPDLSTISVAYATTAGIASYATKSGIATALQNPRTFEITGDIIASSISFDGTGNVSLAATIQPNSVALGSDTTGDYVQSISGTSNQITVTSGTGESSTPTLSIPSQFTAPQDVTVTRDLQVNRNLNINGNITIGGTSATLFTTEFKVYDPDIVLGFRTDGSGNDVSTDNTANHGGIAIASTEGTPLIQLYDVGIGETNPATYKKFMWFKSGTFSGLGTDAWISNYAIGIGSTQVPNGVRLAAGAIQFTENDLKSVRNINASGIVTSTSFVKSGGTSSQFLKADGSVDTNDYLTTTGSGTNLTGIVTSIVAGSNITISGSTGQVTISAAGGGGGGGSSSQWVTTDVGIHTLSKVGIGTTNPIEPGLSVLGKVVIQQDSGSNNRIIFRGQPGSSYRWNIDNYSSSNEFRIFREDDATSANGSVAVSISTTGTLTATKFSGDGSLLTNIPQTKSMTLDNPGAAEKVPMFFTPSQIVINRIQSVIGTAAVGSGVTFSIRYGTDLSAAGTEVVTGGVSAASTTTGTSTTSFNNATVPANNFVWITTSAISGSPTFLHTTLVF